VGACGWALLLLLLLLLLLNYRLLGCCWLYLAAHV
jgi:hypothetical protein